MKILIALLALSATPAFADAPAPVMTYQCSFGLAKNDSMFSGTDELFVDLPIAPLTEKKGEFLPVPGALFGQVTVRQRGLLAEFRGVRTDASEKGSFELLLHPEAQPNLVYSQCWGDLGSKVAGCTGVVPVGNSILNFDLACSLK